jgi:glycosyltransferase involved in cell wall biosynthesis
MRDSYFSLITPMYNRSSTIGRAIESCLSQTFTNFELLITDDASIDNSLAIASSYADPRIKIFRHAKNRGPCSARNTAITNAKGKWCIIMDSDFALLPGALENLFIRTENAPPEVASLASSCQWDTGVISPFPRLPDLLLDFSGYLKWVESVRIPEKLECIRRQVFDKIRFPESRAWEFEFHLDLAYRWKIQIISDVLVNIHTDASNRITAATGIGAVGRIFDDAPDKLVSLERILRDYGASMRESTPRLYNYTVALAANQAFLSNRRIKGIGYISTAIFGRPWSIRLWVLLFLGAVLGPRASAWANVLRRQIVKNN